MASQCPVEIVDAERDIDDIDFVQGDRARAGVVMPAQLIPSPRLVYIM